MSPVADPEGRMDRESRQLETALVSWIAAAPAGFAAAGTTRAACYGLEPHEGEALERRFEALALELFAHQYERVPAYRAYCDAVGRTPATVATSDRVPHLPVEAWKRARIATFRAATTRATFHTSGTTQGTRGAPGVLELDSLSLYDLALARGFRHHVLPDRDAMRLLILAPTVLEAPNSSLSYMLDVVSRRYGAAGSANLFGDGEVRWLDLRDALAAACEAREPVCLLATAFVWVGLLDRARQEGFRIALPAASRAFETGGYKGRVRELSRADLHAGIEQVFGIPRAHVVVEYGMTELGSQYYTLGLRRALLGEPPGDDAWSYPAWLRPRLLDAESNLPRDCGDANAVGLLAHHDLANRGSVAAVLTADLGSPVGPSFELLGRCPRAELRGCGLVHEPLPAGG
jgi:hypothetical protein